MKISFFLCLLLPFLSFGQLFNPEVEWFEEENFFDQEFVRKHSLRQFRASFSTKKDGEIIDETKSFTLASFDREGKLTEMVLGSEWFENVDSTIYTYQYNSKGRLLNKGEFLNQLRYNYIYDYDESGQLEKIMKLDVSQLPTKVVSLKEFAHEVTEAGEKVKYFLNDKGKAYMRKIVEEKGGKLLSKRLEYLVNSNFEEVSFNYIDNKLRTKNFRSNIGKDVQEEFNYYYDERGRLDEIVISKDGERERKIAFVYNSKDLPSAMIVRYFQEKKLDIYQFEYDFYY